MKKSDIDYLNKQWEYINTRAKIEEAEAEKIRQKKKMVLGIGLLIITGLLILAKYIIK